MSKEKKVQSYFQNTLLPSSGTVQDMPHSGNTAIDFKNLLKPQKTFRIAVSGDVQVTRLEREIIDTLDFQRLGGVRQLGSVVHVFRTALHTRFDHSLGTLAMVDRMMRAIATNAGK